MDASTADASSRTVLHRPHRWRRRFRLHLDPPAGHRASRLRLAPSRPPSRLASSSVASFPLACAGAHRDVVNLPRRRHDAVHAVGSEIGLMLDGLRHRAALSSMTFRGRTLSGKENSARRHRRRDEDDRGRHGNTTPHRYVALIVADDRIAIHHRHVYLFVACSVTYAIGSSEQIESICVCAVSISMASSIVFIPRR